MTTTRPALHDRLDAAGPKKMLAIDGGGIRGALSLQVLARIERMLRAETGDDELVLADWFDYMAGTSTGAIIAAGLSTGLEVSALQDLYGKRGKEMFQKAPLLRRFRYLYRHKKLQKLLQDTLGADTTLGDERLRCLLMMVLRNASTDSPWPLSNNPGARFNDRSRTDCNLDLPLWQLVRASTAAPVYFGPEEIRLGGEGPFVFVDGGMTTYNNPAFQLFLMATHDAYGLSWPTGEDAMLLVSVGSGTSARANADLKPREMNLVFNAGSIPSALMYAALNEQDVLCRVLGRCRHGAAVDDELGDLRHGAGVLDERLFTYLRYNADLSRGGLDALGLRDVEPAHVQQLDSVDYIDELRRVGDAVAGEVTREHFAGFLSS